MALWLRCGDAAAAVRRTCWLVPRAHWVLDCIVTVCSFYCIFLNCLSVYCIFLVTSLVARPSLALAMASSEAKTAAEKVERRRRCASSAKAWGGGRVDLRC